MRNFLCLMAAMAFLPSVPALAQDSAITPDLPRFETNLSGLAVSITRSGPNCPPACVEPLYIMDGVETVAELDVIEFLDVTASNGTGLLVDTRAQTDFAKATLPGAVSVPAATVSPENPYRGDLLAALGFSGQGGSATTYTLLVFDQNAASPEAAQAVRDLVQAGYPADKILYYRAGIDGWTALGLSTQPGT